jgi:predicted transcriptional regulator
MVEKPMTVSPDMPVEEAIWLGKKHGIGAFPVLENGELVEMITALFRISGWALPADCFLSGVTNYQKQEGGGDP